MAIYTQLSLIAVPGKRHFFIAKGILGKICIRELKSIIAKEFTARLPITRNFIFDSSIAKEFIADSFITKEFTTSLSITRELSLISTIIKEIRFDGYLC